jgi:hypothetical protein
VSLAEYEQVIMLGHGTPFGLMSVGQFPTSYVISDRHTNGLHAGPRNVYIWCNADQFVQRHNLLSPLYTGMFVSEMGEAMLMGIDAATTSQIKQSNDAFAKAVGRALRNDVRDVSGAVKEWYGDLISDNPVAAYNWERIYGH